MVLKLQVFQRVNQKNKIFKRVKYLICDISKRNNLNILSKKFLYVVNLGGYVDHSDKKKTYNSHYLGCKNLTNFYKEKIQSFVQMEVAANMEIYRLHKEKILHVNQNLFMEKQNYLPPITQLA